ncbi:MAG: 2-C-methyl-D-erythritol 4-phosphate cytidylyltransferase [Eubacteriales bacterium]|nr:2-C-methyl-D-erythritol 4-phosphate cytidylyltransferase [Eubacteriales bacterium]
MSNTKEIIGQGSAARSGKTGAVVLAGGQGKRMQSSVQKQYMLLGGRPLITYALEAFEQSAVDEIVLVTGAGEEDYARQELVEAYGYTKVVSVVAGGRERYHSVYEGLKALKDCDYVLIHDGARPLVTGEIIARAMEGAAEYGACVVGMPVKDTIKVADAACYAKDTPDRTCLWQIQTPQAFSYELVRRCYDRIMAEEALQAGVTDDAMVVESQSDCKVKLIPGSYENLKVTTPEDLVIAEALLAARRAGSRQQEAKR